MGNDILHAQDKLGVSYLWICRIGKREVLSAMGMANKTSTKIP